MWVEGVAEFFGFGFNVVFVVFGDTVVNGLAGHHVNIEIFKRRGFTRVVGHQLNIFNVQLIEHHLAHLLGAHVGIETQVFVSFNGIHALVLQMIGPDFIDKTDTAPFLTQIQQYATAVFDDIFHRPF